MHSTRPIRRRDFLAGAALGAAAGLPIRARAGTSVTLTMVTAWPKGAPGVGINAQRFAERVQAMSGGRLNIRFYAAGELVPAFEALDAVQSGTADIAHSSPYYWVGKSPELHYFTGVPFGMTASEFSAWLYFGGGQALWEEVYAPFGVVPFYAGSSGTQAGGWFNRRIDTVGDFRGLKMRIAGLGGEVLRRLGATPVMTSPGEIAAALASGTVDAADWIGPWNDVAFGLHKFARYYYLPGFHEPGPSLEIIVNQKRLQGLDPDLQAILRCAAQASAIETLADFNYHNTESFDALLSEHHVETLQFPQPVLERLREESSLVLEELGDSSPRARRIHGSFQAFLDKAAAYSPRAEGGYLSLRAG